MSSIGRITIDYVSALLKGGDNVLILGAGASVESGGPTMTGLIKSFITDYLDLTPQKLDDLKEADIYDLFYRYIDGLDNRTRFGLLESVFSRMKPSPGYLHLVRLLGGVFDVVISANVDLMLEVALCRAGRIFGRDYVLYIAGHDSEERDNSLRLTRWANSDKPKILKIHGSLYDEFGQPGFMRFTPSETRALPSHIRDRCLEFTQRVTLIYGFSMRDKGVNDALCTSSSCPVVWVNRRAPQYEIDPEAFNFLVLRNSWSNCLSGPGAQFDTFFRLLSREYRSAS